MAGDWVKVEKVTPDKPEIAMLGGLLGISHGEAFLQWFRVFSWADGITADGFVPFLSLSEGDMLSRSCPGTCAALAHPKIGWLVPEDGGLRFRNWHRHNGESAKRRCQERDKKRRQRNDAEDLSRKCPEGIGTKSGPEKRREEKNTLLLSPPLLCSAEEGGGSSGGMGSDLWRKAADIANSVNQSLEIRKTDVQTDKDHRMVIAAAWLSLTMLGADWLTDAVDDTQKKRRRDRSIDKVGYLRRCLATGAEARGENLDRLLVNVKIPEALCKRKATT